MLSKRKVTFRSFGDTRKNGINYALLDRSTTVLPLRVCRKLFTKCLLYQFLKKPADSQNNHYEFLNAVHLTCWLVLLACVQIFNASLISWQNRLIGSKPFWHTNQDHYFIKNSNPNRLKDTFNPYLRTQGRKHSAMICEAICNWLTFFATSVCTFQFSISKLTAGIFIRTRAVQARAFVGAAYICEAEEFNNSICYV